MKRNTVRKDEITLSAAILEVGSLLHQNGKATPRLLWRTLSRRFPKLISQEAARMMTDRIWRLWARMQMEEGEQLPLPGLDGIPSGLILVGADGPYSVPTLAATFAQDLEALRIRDENVVRVVAHRDAFRAFVEKVRPVMADDPEMTNRQALERLGLWDDGEPVES